LASALTAYIDASGELDNCGSMAQAYIQSLQSGAGPEAASRVASQLYLRAVRSYRSLSPACLAAAEAWREAYKAGLAPVLPAARAYIEASGSSSPCSAAARSYLDNFQEGEESEALVASMQAFFTQFSSSPSLDPACSKAALAMAAESDSPTAAALQAFIQKAEELGGSAGYDPVCAGAAQTFIKSYTGGADLERTRTEAAQTFVSLYLNNPTAAQESPCAAATKAYAEAVTDSSDSASLNALTAFLSEAAATNSLGVEPVCAEAARAFLSSLLAGQSKEEADQAAAVAYLAAWDANPASRDTESPCSKAADAYIANYRK